MSIARGNVRLANSRVWHCVDMRGRTLGRTATAIALTLMGKHKPVYDPAADIGDYVVATNCAHLAVTGAKRTDKLYRRHTGRPGHLKEITMDRLIATKGAGEVLRKAVSGMLPKNRLRDLRLARLKTFEDEAHPYKLNILKRLDLEAAIGNKSTADEQYYKEEI